MAHRLQRGLTSAQRTELWQRWRHGETVSDIARALGAWHGTISYTIRRQGGFSPTPRRRAAHRLSLTEREEISRDLALGYSLRHISRKLGRAPSTISREVQRNGGRRDYRAAGAYAEGVTPVTRGAALLIRFRFSNARQRRMIGPYPGIGRVICWSDRQTAMWRR